MSTITCNCGREASEIVDGECDGCRDLDWDYAPDIQRDTYTVACRFVFVERPAPVWDEAEGEA